jgi:hypothetical protein
MAQITVDSDEFQNIISCFLLECLQTRRKGEFNFTNELWNQVLDHMWNAGIRSNLLYAYINMNGNDRIKYKMINDALFNIGNNNSLIRVNPVKEADSIEE